MKTIIAETMTPSEELTALSDLALSERFARDYLGREIWSDGNQPLMSVPGQSDGSVDAWTAIPPFASSADCVLPFLPKEHRGGYWSCSAGSAGVFLHIRDGDGRVIADAKAETFPRAACICLILATRAAKAGMT